MKTRQILSISIYLFITCHLLADIAPTITPGYSLKSFSETTIQMKKETVDIFVGEESRVEARFYMYNPGKRAEKIMVGFPIWPRIRQYHKRNLSRRQFSVRVNGEAVSPIYSEGELEKKKSLYPKMDDPVEWFGWENVFEPGETLVEVTYRIFPNNSYKSASQNVYYILSSGASWDGPIGEASVTVHQPDGIHPEQILPSTKPQGFQLEGESIRWHMSTIEPSKNDNIHLTYIPGKLYQDILRLRSKIQNHPSDAGSKYELALLYFSTLLTLPAKHNTGLSGEMVSEAQECIEGATVLDASNAEYWNTYIMHYGRMFDGGTTIWGPFDPKDISQQNKNLIQKAHRFCPTDPGISFWTEILDSSKRPIPSCPFQIEKKNGSTWISLVSSKGNPFNPEKVSQETLDMIAGQFKKKMVHSQKQIYKLCIKSIHPSAEQRKKVIEILNRFGYYNHYYRSKLWQLMKDRKHYSRK